MNTKSLIKINKVNFGFTLAEVLITLVIIGVIAAVTIPQIVNNYKWKQYQAATFKAKSMLDNSAIKFKIEYGYPPECGYWKKNPYGGATCVSRNAQGFCSKYTLTSTGGNLPSDYNGNFSDCTRLYQFWLKSFNVTKVCTSNSYANGCIPKYQGRNTIHKSTHEDVSDYDLNASFGSSAFGIQSSILSGPAFITSDGMIFFTYVSGGSAIQIAVDVNGFKGPNKWGHDVRGFNPKAEARGDIPVFVPWDITEGKSLSTASLLYGQN